MKGKGKETLNTKGWRLEYVTYKFRLEDEANLRVTSDSNR